MLFHLEMLNISTLIEEFLLKSQLYFINEGHYNSISRLLFGLGGKSHTFSIKREVGDSPEHVAGSYQ